MTAKAPCDDCSSFDFSCTRLCKKAHAPYYKDFDCEHCIGMPEQPCYCKAHGAIAPGGPIPFGICLRIKEIKVPVWHSPGNGASVRRSSLSDEHPESVPNWIRNNLNIEPEEWMLK